MRSPDTLTRQERATQNAQGRAILAELTKKPGFSLCAYCVHGVSGWGLHACSQEGRTPKTCSKRPGIKFEPDLTKIPRVK